MSMCNYYVEIFFPEDTLVLVAITIGVLIAIAREVSSDMPIVWYWAKIICMHGVEKERFTTDRPLTRKASWDVSSRAFMSSSVYSVALRCWFTLTGNRELND